MNVRRAEFLALLCTRAVSAMESGWWVCRARAWGALGGRQERLVRCKEEDVFMAHNCSVRSSLEISVASDYKGPSLSQHTRQQPRLTAGAVLGHGTGLLSINLTPEICVDPHTQAVHYEFLVTIQKLSH